MAVFQNEQTGDNYEIKLKGHLNESWAGWLEDLTFAHESDGTTTLTGENIDQAALHGLLKKIRDLGLSLISVNRLDSGHSGMPKMDRLIDKPTD